MSVKHLTIIPLGILVFLSTAKASDYCTYHPYDLQSCNTRQDITNSISSQEHTTVIDRTYFNQVVDIPIIPKENISPSSSSNTMQKQDTDQSNQSNNKQEQSNSNQKTVKSKTIGVGALISDDINAYVLPFSFDITNSFTAGATLSYVDNSIQKESGIGDSTVMFDYKKGNINSLGLFTTSLNILIPTGDVEKGIGTGAYSYTLSERYRKVFKNIGFGMLFSISYTLGSKTDKFSYQNSQEEYEIAYGNKLMSAFGIEKKLSNSVSARSKITYVANSENEINSNKQNDSSSFTDIIVGVDTTVINSTVFSIGVITPVSDSYEDGVSDKPDRKSSYYFTFGKTF